MTEDMLQPSEMVVPFKSCFQIGRAELAIWTAEVDSLCVDEVSNVFLE
jgi:hypothetical protein